MQMIFLGNTYTVHHAQCGRRGVDQQKLNLQVALRQIDRRLHRNGRRVATINVVVMSIQAVLTTKVTVMRRGAPRGKGQEEWTPFLGLEKATNSRLDILRTGFSKFHRQM